MRGVVTVQFSWIFVFIVGAVLLTFFISVVRQQGAASSEQLAVDLSQHLETLLKNTEQSGGTLKKIVLPATTLEFTCSGNQSSYGLRNSAFRQEAGQLLIFGPERLAGSSLYAWTQSWEVPYRVTNFVFLTNEDVEYIFVDDLGTATETLYEKFPANLSKRLVAPEALTSVTDTNAAHYRIVYTEDAIQSMPQLPDEKVSRVRFETTRNQAWFYQGNGNEPGQFSYYVGDALQYAAIFATSKSFYECGLEKALTRYRMLTSVVLARAEAIQAALSPTDPCRPIYGPSIATLTDLLAATENDPSFFAEVDASTRALRRDNEDLIRGTNCPLLY